MEMPQNLYYLMIFFILSLCKLSVNLLLNKKLIAMKNIFLILFSIFSLTLFSQDAETLYKEGEALYNQGKENEAIAKFTETIKLDPEMMNAYLQRAAIYSYLKQYDKAVQDYTVVIKSDNKQIWSYISRGSAYNKLEKYNKALADFNTAIRLDPENQEAYNNRGWSKKFLGDKDGACKDWKTSKKKGNKEAKIILKNNGC